MNATLENVDHAVPLDSYHTSASTTELQRAREYINSIDFNKIIHKLVFSHKWLPSDAHKACEQYKNFLFLQKKYGSDATLVPSVEIDEFWHMHILDTKRYKQDCDKIFGRYLDHYPYLGMDGKSSTQDVSNYFNRTLELYRTEFNGKEVIALRTLPAIVLGACYVMMLSLMRRLLPQRFNKRLSQV